MKKGDILSNYVIDKQIGQGGNSKVYLAKSNLTSEQVAIKILEKNKNKDRFEREIKFLKHHNHDQITKYIDDGYDSEGNRFHVCKFYPEDLNRIIIGNIQWEDKLEFAIQLAEGLKYLHDNAIFHRDLKPENIYLSDMNKLVIGDFGLITDEVDSLTKATDRMANAFYAAPEQLIKGNSNNLDSKVDIYAFGKLINLLFTKNNLSGTDFAKIEDSYPFLYELDILVNKMIIYSSSKRPAIKSVYYELIRIKDELDIKKEDILATLDINEGLTLSSRDYSNISQDLYYAQMIYATYNVTDFEEFDCNWHLKYNYSINEKLENLCFNELAYKTAKDKFLYEGNVGISHPPLDAKKNPENMKIYEEFCELLDYYSLGTEYQSFVNRTKRYFNSCCDYHAREIIVNLKRYWEQFQKNVFDAPILWLLRSVKNIIEVNQRIFGEELIYNITLCRIRVIPEGDYNPLLKKSITKNELEENINILIKLESEQYIAGYDIKEKYTLFFEKEQFKIFKHDCYKSKHAERYSGEVYTSDKRSIIIEDIDDVFRYKKEYEMFITIEISSYEILKIKQLLF